MRSIPDVMDKKFDFSLYLKEKRHLVNSSFERWIETGDDASTLQKAMHYALTAGGKRLRPILCLAACEATGAAVTEACIRAACALEMVHTYSLIHDDLPAMDNDDLRRGKPTCHLAFDEATAVLAGDALLTLAFEVMSSGPAESGCPPDVLLEGVRILSGAAGFRGMIQGQMEDMSYENTPIAVEVLERMHARKTGALIRASVQMGAVMAGAPEHKVALLVRYADSIGLAFQVTDDILNVTGDPEIMGKAAGTVLQRVLIKTPAIHED